MATKRLQLTLFVDPNDSVEIEKIRRVFNPEQYDLIKSHVTLCREDELTEIEQVLQNLKLLNHHCISVHFSNVIRFSNEKGVLIPAAEANMEFDELRKVVLAGAIEHPSVQKPHITLMHPRNSSCTNIIFQHIKKVVLPNKLTFCKISLIEQFQDTKWQIVEEFKLAR